MVNPYKFKLLSRSCVSPEEYELKILYLSLSVVAITFIGVVLLRIAIKRCRRAPATSIGRLVEHLLIVQGACVCVAADRSMCCYWFHSVRSGFGG